MKAGRTLSLGLKWHQDGDGYALSHGRRRAMLHVVPDAKYPGILWRVRHPDGRLSDMVNLSRAKDAARAIALAALAPKGNSAKRGGEAPGSDLNGAGVSRQGSRERPLLGHDSKDVTKKRGRPVVGAMTAAERKRRQRAKGAGAP
jgi:hypothetical protein